ncbi:hypothetical protein [Streptomyces sp. NPDC056883]|uniref:hypothetical protein n=1 Tax=Streptomyces sp. NPDC056883 TaxID=3345959 RepID=UPI0036A9CB81
MTDNDLEASLADTTDLHAALLAIGAINRVSNREELTFAEIINKGPDDYRLTMAHALAGAVEQQIALAERAAVSSGSQDQDLILTGDIFYEGHRPPAADGRDQLRALHHLAQRLERLLVSRVAAIRRGDAPEGLPLRTVFSSYGIASVLARLLEYGANPVEDPFDHAGYDERAKELEQCARELENMREILRETADGFAKTAATLRKDEADRNARFGPDR